MKKLLLLFGLIASIAWGVGPYTKGGWTSDGTLTADAFSGDGSAITAISAANISTGTLAVDRGGTGVTSSTGSGSVVLDTNPAITVTANGVASCNGGGNICSGSYAPSDQGGTCTPGTINNVGTWFWTRVGNVVSVHGNADFNCSTGAGTILINEPIPSAFNQGNGQDAAGTASAQVVGDLSAGIRADDVGDHIQIQFESQANQAYYVHFQYIIK